MLFFYGMLLFGRQRRGQKDEKQRNQNAGKEMEKKLTNELVDANL